MTAGYSGKPLFEKLGIKKEMKIQLIEPPKENFTLLQQNISSQFCKKSESRTSFICLRKQIKYL